MARFRQLAPTLENSFSDDALLQSYLEKHLSADDFKAVSDDLTRLGERLVTDVLAMADDVDRNPPRHVPYSSTGERVDRIEVAQGWLQLDRVSAEEGMIATAYEREFGDLSRPIQWAKLYLFHPSSSYYTCPLAMTDGAAKLLERFGDRELFEDVFDHLTSRDPDVFWTSGQWMTEIRGGSDVSGTDTVAREEDGKWRLYGEK